MTNPSKHAFRVGSIYRVKQRSSFFYSHVRNEIVDNCSEIYAKGLNNPIPLIHGELFTILESKAIVGWDARAGVDFWHAFRILFKDKMIWVYLIPEAVNRFFEQELVKEVLIPKKTL